jgi:hypothetical protein
MARVPIGFVLIAAVGCGDSMETTVLRSHVAGLSEEVKSLKGEIATLQQALPDQSAVMTRVGYHTSALLPAIQAENWPLAGFFLEQTFANLRTAVRIRPVHTEATGRPVKLADILESIEDTQLVALRGAIERQDRTAAEKAYEQLMVACYGCHVAADRPFLRPKPPERAEVEVLDFDPDARIPATSR